MRKSTWLLVCVVVALLAHSLLWLDLPLLLQAAVALILAGLLPGLLLVEVLVGQSEAPPALGEYLLYAIASGYTVMVMVMLLISYLPGGVARWQTLAGFDLVLLILLALVWWRTPLPIPPQPGEGAVPSQPNHLRLPANSSLPSRGGVGRGQPLLLIGLLLLAVVGGYLRFANLGYAEFQGDEARATLRAAAVIQGVEDVLMIHKKGPTEILLPTVVYSLTGHLNEATARLPFTLANFFALFAVFLLGWRLVGPVAGWSAAFLLAFDGYLIGFSQIVQYQSIILLTSALVVLILYRLYRQPKALTEYLLLASLFLATGLLSHYEAAQAAVPAFVLLAAALIQRRVGWLALLRAAIPAVLVGGLLLASFYVPFVRHPHFEATYTYLVDRRLGGDSGVPYNNLKDFFLRSTVYNSTYDVVLLIVLVTLALFAACRRTLNRTLANLLGVGLLLLWGLTFWNDQWLLIGNRDWIVVPFALAFLLAWVLPKLKIEERTLWLWFGAPMLLAFFFTAKPRSHVYIFFIPWMLLAGSSVAAGWRRLRSRIGQAGALAVSSVAIALVTLVFGGYAYWYFVYNQVEILRTWDVNRPAGYWVSYAAPDDKALFGFPLANGWKVVGALYAQGVIHGDFETNEKEAWVPAWYTRGERRCGRSADWYFEIDNLEPWGNGDQLAMEHFLRGGFEKWGKVAINGADRMVIYKRTGKRIQYPDKEPNTGLQTFQLTDYQPSFDLLASPQLTLTYPIIEKPIGHPLHINLGHEIWLEGYDIAYSKPLKANDAIQLTIYWRAQKQLTANYKVFNQSFYGNGTMIAQKDGYPVCDTRETWRWDPGELVTDDYDLPIKADAPDGLYPLYTGMYLEENGTRLPIVDEQGNPTQETQVHLTDIRVGPEP